MARTARRCRRLWDAYCFPGFRPEPTVRGIFGDPKARVIGLNRRSKKPFVVVAVAVRRAGTIIRFAGCAICRAATRGFSWNWRCAGSLSQLRQGEARSGSTFWRTIRTTPSALPSSSAGAVDLDDPGRCRDLHLDWKTVKALDQQYMQAQLRERERLVHR